jgi:pyruvate/2-oxoglutarate dehydrogenase complex dihydrolipoamide acyltransferase (E2) component
MQTYEVRLPSLGDDNDAVHGGTISIWHAKKGQTLAEGDDLLELTTDKAAFVLPCPRTGTLEARMVEEGATVQVGDVVCVLSVTE